MKSTEESKKILLISGFIAGIDQLPENLEISGPQARLALITETYAPHIEGSFAINSEQILAILRKICFGFEAKICLEEHEEASDFHGLSDEYLLKRISEDFFYNISVLKKGLLIFQIFGAHWYKTGGPYPYHDTATLEMIFPAASTREVLERVQMNLRELKQPFEIQEADLVPMPKSLIRKIFESLFN